MEELIGIFLRVSGAAILAAVVGTVLEGVSKTGRLTVRVAAVTVLYGGVLLLLLPLVTRVLSLCAGEALAPHVGLILRCLGISLLAQIVTGVCRDLGETSLSVTVETAGKALILLLALPTVEDLLETVSDLLSGV